MTIRWKRYLVKGLMFISSYFPLYVMLLLLHYDKYDNFDKLHHFKVIVFISTMVVCIIISLISVMLLKISSGGKPLKIDELERPDDTIISYMMTYIIPILTTDLMNKGAILVNVILFLLIGYLYVRLNLLYLNPLWSMFGYLSYRVNSDVVLITNIKCSDLKVIKSNNKALIGFYMADDIFIVKRKDNGL